MVASSQIGCTKSELIPKRDAKGRALISLFVRNPLQTRKLHAMCCLQQTWADTCHLYRLGGKQKAKQRPVPHPSSTEATGTR